jgi:hypothetical protein
MSSLFKSRDEDKDVEVIKKQADGQADINIFTVASGLLYEVGTLQVPVDACLHVFRLALCFDHDTERAPQHQEQRQVLVYRKLPFPFLPCECYDLPL